MITYLGYLQPHPPTLSCTALNRLVKQSIVVIFRISQPQATPELEPFAVVARSRRSAAGAHANPILTASQEPANIVRCKLGDHTLEASSL